MEQDSIQQDLWEERMRLSQLLEQSFFFFGMVPNDDNSFYVTCWCENSKKCYQLVMHKFLLAS